MSRINVVFGALVVAQAAHSIEEYVGRLWESFPPAAFLTGLISADRELGFLVAAVGATFREIIDMNDLDASLATNAPGQSGQPGSPFYMNLLESYGRAEYFPLAYSRAAVERYAAHRLQLVKRAP